MRIFIAWIVGIGLFILTIILSDLLAKYIGFTTYIDYGETITVTRNRYYDEEISGHHTSMGIFFMFLSYSIAIRGGMAVNSGKLSGNVSKKGNFQLLVFGSALLLYGLGGHLFFFIFNLSGFFAKLIDIGLGVGIAYLSYNYYEQRVEKFDNKKND